MPNKHTSDPIRFSDARVESEYFRADLEIIGLDHSGASFEGRVFADNPEAGENTPQSLKNATWAASTSSVTVAVSAR